MTAPVASAIVASLALLIGVFNVWYSVIRPWRRSRWASPAATLELLTYPTKSGWETEERVVVTNVGPASMKDVTAAVCDKDGREYDQNVVALWPRMPVPTLYAGQILHLKLNKNFGQTAPGSVVLRWRDGRSGIQAREIWLSYQRVI